MASFGFGQYLWPPVQRQQAQSTSQGPQQMNAGGDLDMDDPMHDEQLIPDRREPHQAHALQVLPIISVNSVPVPPALGNLNTTLMDHASQRQTRTPSPRGSKRNSPRPSPERSIIRVEAAQQESTSSKIRLVNIPDPQQEASMEELKQHLVRSNKLLERVEKDLLAMKQNAAAAKELAERAENRAINAEKALESQRLQAEQRLQKLQSDIQAEASKQIHEAEKRAEVTLKSMKSIGRAGSSGNSSGQYLQIAADDDMLVDRDQDQLQLGSRDKGKGRAIEKPVPMPSAVRDPQQIPIPQIPAPPRFPEPLTRLEDVVQETPVPPLSFKRPKSGGKAIPVPPTNYAFLHGGSEENYSNGNSSEEEEEEEEEEGPRRKSKMNASPITDLNGEEMVRLLLSSLGLDITSIGSVNKSGRRRAHREFKEPAKKMPKARGKQDLMNWLRKHLHILLDIKKSRDILKFSSEIHSKNTPLQRHMEQWEDTKVGEGPKVEPMKINWNNFDGPWNIRLCELFVDYCIAQGLEGGNPSDEAKEFVAGYFWDRLTRLRTIVKKSRPKGNETSRQTLTRTEEQHLQALSVARRNSRRNQARGFETFSSQVLIHRTLQKHHDRIDICLENLPEDIASIVTDEQKDWKTKYDIVMALGPEGMSSDETDDDDSDKYWIRTLPWRNKRATQVMIAVDEAKNTTNGYGNIRAGNRPRNRQRKKNARESARKAPIGKAKNLYDSDWFGGLDAGKKRVLKAKPNLKYE